jgi:hypothetical protein
VSSGYVEALAAAERGTRWSGGYGGVDIIPGLYGMRSGRGWVEWAPERDERIARVKAHFGVND